MRDGGIFRAGLRASRTKTRSSDDGGKAHLNLKLTDLRPPEAAASGRP